MCEEVEACARAFQCASMTGYKESGNKKMLTLTTKAYKQPPDWRACQT